MPEGEHRDALLRDLGEMRDLITDLLESERLAAGHAALQTETVDLAATQPDILARLPQCQPQVDVAQEGVAQEPDIAGVS